MTYTYFDILAPQATKNNITPSVSLLTEKVNDKFIQEGISIDTQNIVHLYNSKEYGYA